MNVSQKSLSQRLTALATAALFAFGCLSSVAGSALAATTQIGSVAEIGAAALPAALTAGGFGVQISEASGTYAVPPGYSTITDWSHSAGTTAGVLTFKVYRPTGALHEFLVVGSDTQTVTAGSVQTFPVQIAVQPGDRIGLSSDSVELAFETFDPNDQIGFFGGDLPIGATRATDGDPFPDYKLDVAATLTSDPAPAPPVDPTGTVPPAGAPSPPSLSQLSLSPASFRAARADASTRSSALHGFGTRVRYRLDRAATVRFAVQHVTTGRKTGRGKSARCVVATKSNRKAARCTRYVSVGSFSKPAQAAANAVNFTGRLAGRALKPGSYRLVATATAGGVVGNSVTRTFRIVR